MKKIDANQAMEELTMILMYLSRFEEAGFESDEKFYYTWKGYDFDIINKARRVPDHSYTESSQNWTQSDFLQFRHSISKIEELLKNYE